MRDDKEYVYMGTTMWPHQSLTIMCDESTRANIVIVGRILRLLDIGHVVILNYYTHQANTALKAF